MVLLAGAALALLAFLVFRRWRRTLPDDPRLTLAFWRNSALALGFYLLVLLAGAGVARFVGGFRASDWVGPVMAGFYAVWALYGGVWFLRFLPGAPPPRFAWLRGAGYWPDILAIALLAGLVLLLRQL